MKERQEIKCPIIKEEMTDSSTPSTASTGGGRKLRMNKCKVLAGGCCEVWIMEASGPSLDLYFVFSVANV